VLSDTFEPIFKNYLVHNLSTHNASPSKKVLRIAIELFEEHHPVAPVALHVVSLLNRMYARTDLLLYSPARINLPFHHSVLSCPHTLDFI
jgi:hypothetical protein